MDAKILDGSKIANSILKKLKESVATYIEADKRAPKLVIILVGNDYASEKYVTHKISAAEKIGAIVELIRLSSNITFAAIENVIKSKNNDPTVDGIIVQFPLPAGISKEKILLAIDKDKDVDGFHPWNIGCIAQDNFSQVSAATPLGIMELLEHYKIKLKGKHVVVVGASAIVGRPMALLALNEKATVTITHKYTKKLESFTKQADILIVAVGKKNLITAEMIKENAVVIDVGINRDENNKICGDVDFANVVKKASHISPVPGGIGPMTIASLMSNLMDLYEKKFF